MISLSNVQKATERVKESEVSKFQTKEHNKSPETDINKSTNVNKRELKPLSYKIKKIMHGETENLNRGIKYFKSTKENSRS